MTELAETCEAIGLDFDLDAAIASNVSVGDAALLALCRAPSLDERALIRSGAMLRPRLNFEEPRLHA